MTRYNAEIERSMCIHYAQLSEKDQRHYAAVEALKLSYGGQKYIGELFQISQTRLKRGIKELKDPQLRAEIPEGMQRRIGGGRKKKELSEPQTVELLSALINTNKAGSPTDPSVYWIHLTPREIATLFNQTYESKVSNGFVKRLLKTMGFKYRKMSKTLATGHCEHRDAQFKIIFELVALMSLDTPVLSIDCKKKERLGNLYRSGRLYSTAPIKVFDHDYFHLSKGSVIPHGIYDLQRNTGYISIGSSHETAEFIADNLFWWWEEYGIHQYPDAPYILILCDAGGGNDYRHHKFKMQMILLAEKIGIDIIICHYPPYASKWNPIEHRLFCHVNKAMQGVVFSDYNIVKQLISKTKTDTGLNVHVRLNLKEYPVGFITTKEEVDYSKIQFNKKVPKLSYRIAA